MGRGGRPTVDDDNSPLRVRGFELYLKGAMDTGQKISYRAIAMSLGVTQPAVRYWHKVDRWDERVDASLQQRTIKVTQSSQAIENLLRTDFYRNVKKLTAIIQDPKVAVDDRIKAVVAYTNICYRFKVIHPSDLSETPATMATGFKDDLPGLDEIVPDSGPKDALEAFTRPILEDKVRREIFGDAVESVGPEDVGESAIGGSLGQPDDTFDGSLQLSPTDAGSADDGLGGRHPE